ncbi:313_t:CDS:1, partial [Scutellospora calospora]
LGLCELSLKVAISEYNIEIYEALYEDFVGTTLIFDGWTNVNNKQLMI